MPKTLEASGKRPARVRKRTHAASSLEGVRETLQRLQSLELPVGDGDRMESDWHVVHISLLDELVRLHLGETHDYFCGGNMFLYYSLEQVQEIIEYVNEEAEVVRRPRFKGPDFFLVKGVDGRKPRDYWEVWNEGGRYPDLIVEFISSSTRKKDVDKNVQFYQQVFRTPEYFWFDRRKGELKGYRLRGGQYEAIAPNERGWLWSEQLGAYLGAWEGEYRGRRYLWLRLYTRDGELVPTREERERQAQQRAEQERTLREQAERRLAELEAELKRLRGESD